MFDLSDERIMLIVELFRIAYDRYPEPKRAFDDKHVEIRSYEIWAYSVALWECVNNLSKPIDEILYLYYCKFVNLAKECTKSRTRLLYKSASQVILYLLNYLDMKGDRNE